MIVEDTPDALDTGIFERTAGSKSTKVFVPQRPAVPEEPIAGPTLAEPGPIKFDHFQESVDVFEVPPTIKKPRRQYNYLKEFVSQVDDLLEALLGREALPNEGQCVQCAGQKPGRWRCKDCTVTPLLCRCCMRESHKNNPLHQIEFWTGNHFRAASLWEVGAFILVPHWDKPHLCQTLTWEVNMLERLQRFKDEEEEMGGNEPINEEHGTGLEGHDPTEEPGPNEISDDQLADDDVWFTKQLETIYTHGAPPDVMEEEEEDDGADADVTHNASFQPYMPRPDELNQQAIAGFSTPDRPPRDALNNQYIRVIHSNGVHHIGLVSCTCQGSNRLPIDLMYAGFVPTSFKRIRTLFTISVLDFFRYSNLEMKASAYQFFQLLRRVTMPMAPSEVVNFYHELRRLSRVWRWMKKLKWAGLGHKKADAMNPAKGELSVFCPACPQPGINLGDDWLHDPKR